MSKQRKRKYLQIVVTFLCICMLGGFSGKQVHAETGYALIPKVKEAQTGWFVKYWSGWKYIYANGKCPKNKWKKINNKIYYFDKNGYRQTGWKKYKNSWYYLRKSGKNKGALCTGWKTISGKRYFLAKKTGARVTGWHTIKNTLYYFNNKGVLQKGKTVGEYQLDEITGAAIKIATEPDTSEVTDDSNTTGGDADNTATTVNKLHIFVGDSRTVGLSNTMGCVSYDKLLQIRTEENLTEYYLAEVGSGYSWYSTKALPRLVKMLNENPAATVILNHGINDLGNIDQYIASYQWLIGVYPNTKFVIMSVNPVNRKLYKGYAKPANITVFNQKMQAAFPNNFVNTYQYLQSMGFNTADGLHYDSLTYMNLYNYMQQYL